MLKLSIVILFLLAFIVPIVILIFIVDQKRKGLKMFILGVLTYIIAEACIKLPVLGVLGYAESAGIKHLLFLCTIGAVFVETVRFIVLKLCLKRKTFSIFKFAMYSAGFICAYIFVIWGIDSVGTAAVVFLEDFKLIDAKEIWNEIITIITLIPVQFGIVLLCVCAIKYKNVLYFLGAIMLRILSDLDLVFYLCNKWQLGSGVGILYLAAICVIIIMFMRKQIKFLEEGIKDEDI